MGAAIVGAVTEPVLADEPLQSDYRARYNAERLSRGQEPLPPEYDAHHRIPRKYRGHAEYEGFDFDAPGNIRGVKGSRAVWAGKARGDYHGEISKWWAEFQTKNPGATRAQIDDFANRIDKTHSRYYFK